VVEKHLILPERLPVVCCDEEMINQTTATTGDEHQLKNLP